MKHYGLYSLSAGLLAPTALCLAPADEGTAPAPTTDTKSKLDFEPSDTKYFPPTNLAGTDGAEGYCSKITAWAAAQTPAIPVHMNFTDQVPEGFGIQVQPVQKRDKSKEELVLTHLIIAAVPDISAVMANEKGAFYMRDVLREAFGRRLKTGVIAALKANSAVQLPNTLDGFIESIRRVSPLYTYNQIQEQVRKSLDKKEVKVSKEMLQGILMSSSFAQQVFPNTKQAQWELVLDRMIVVAKNKNLDPAILEQWKTTRNEALFSHDDSVDFGDLQIE